jgi:hypothetical protein
MMTKLLALSVGVAMLSGVGIASADAVVPTDVPMRAGTAGQVRIPGHLLLTETQMEKVTAGHLRGPGPNHVHYGPYYHKSCSWFVCINYKRSGWHRGTGG